MTVTFLEQHDTLLIQLEYLY